jgi:serine/threonine-protein kinase
MSPEQAAGRTDEIDHPVDQWALACIAWEMLSGHTPFVADDVTALFYQVMNLQPQSLLLRVPGLAPEAEVVLLRALSKSPRDRFPSIREFAHAFETAALGRPADLTPPPVSLSHLSASVGNVALESTLASETASEGKKRTPKQLTTFSRTAGEMTDEIPRRSWSRLGLKPVYAVAVMAVVLGVMGGIFLLRPRPSPTVTAASPVRPSVVTLPSVAPTPDSVPLPPPGVTAKATESPAKTTGGKSRSKRLQLGDAEDPFEPGASSDKQKKAKAPPPPDLFHRTDTGRPASPLQSPVKRTIIKEL